MNQKPLVPSCSEFVANHDAPVDQSISSGSNNEIDVKVKEAPTETLTSNPMKNNRLSDKYPRKPKSEKLKMLYQSLKQSPIKTTNVVPVATTTDTTPISSSFIYSPIVPINNLAFNCPTNRNVNVNAYTNTVTAPRLNTSQHAPAYIQQQYLGKTVQEYNPQYWLPYSGIMHQHPSQCILVQVPVPFKFKIVAPPPPPPLPISEPSCSYQGPLFQINTQLRQQNSSLNMVRNVQCNNLSNENSLSFANCHRRSTDYKRRKHYRYKQRKKIKREFEKCEKLNEKLKNKSDYIPQKLDSQEVIDTIIIAGDDKAKDLPDETILDDWMVGYLNSIVAHQEQNLSIVNTNQKLEDDSSDFVAGTGLPRNDKASHLPANLILPEHGKPLDNLSYDRIMSADGNDWLMSDAATDFLESTQRNRWELSDEANDFRMVINAPQEHELSHIKTNQKHSDMSNNAVYIPEKLNPQEVIDNQEINDFLEKFILPENVETTDDWLNAYLKTITATQEKSNISDDLTEDNSILPSTAKAVGASTTDWSVITEPTHEDDMPLTLLMNLNRFTNINFQPAVEEPKKILVDSKLVNQTINIEHVNNSDIAAASSCTYPNKPNFSVRKRPVKVKKNISVDSDWVPKPKRSKNPKKNMLLQFFAMENMDLKKDACNVLLDQYLNSFKSKTVNAIQDALEKYLSYSNDNRDQNRNKSGDKPFDCPKFQLVFISARGRVTGAGDKMCDILKNMGGFSSNDCFASE